METTTKPDGTKVQTETKKDGTKVETTTAKDGSTSKTTTNPNGSSVTENKAADGSTGTVKTDKHGQTTAETQPLDGFTFFKDFATIKREEIYKAEVYDSEGTLAVPRGTPWDNSSLPQGGKSVTDKSAIIFKPSTAQAFETLWKRGRVLFFSAPCGFGKTVLADTLLDGRPVLRLNAADTGFALPSLEDAWDVLLIDNIQDMQEERDWQALCALIRESTDRRFVLLSRGIPPACLMAFQYAGMMTVLSAEDLLFDREDIRRLLQACGAEATDSEIGAILKETSGYPLCAAILARHMAAGQPYGAELTAQAYGTASRRGGAAAAGRAGMVGKREMAQTADGGCAGTGRHISPFFAAKAFHERGTDGSGDAGAAADFRGSIKQCPRRAG